MVFVSSSHAAGILHLAASFCIALDQLQNNSRDRAFLGVCSNAKDWAVFVSYGELISASGLIAVTFDHRLPERSQVKAAVTRQIPSQDWGLRPLPRGSITSLSMSGLQSG